MKKHEPVIIFDHMEDEKSKPMIVPHSRKINFFELSMFLAEEMLAIIILLSMFFLL